MKFSLHWILISGVRTQAFQADSQARTQQGKAFDNVEEEFELFPRHQQPNPRKLNYDINSNKFGNLLKLWRLRKRIWNPLDSDSIHATAPKFDSAESLKICFPITQHNILLNPKWRNNTMQSWKCTKSMSILHFLPFPAFPGPENMCLTQLMRKRMGRGVNPLSVSNSFLLFSFPPLPLSSPLLRDPLYPISGAEPLTGQTHI